MLSPKLPDTQPDSFSIPDYILNPLDELPSLNIDADPLHVSNISIRFVVSISIVFSFFNLNDDYL